MRIQVRVPVLLFASVVVGFAALPAWAQEEEAAPGAELAESAQPTGESEAGAAEEEEAAPAPGGVERMVVTARKREESLQEVPVAVSGFDEKTLEGLGVSQTDDVAALAPNVYVTQTPGSAANVGVSIRGIGGAEPLLTRDTGVALYVDGAYIARTSGAVFDLVDLERVEVLRGPQGTLYGRNATGGAVNFISRRPKEAFGFEQTVGYGLYDSWLTRTTIDTGELGESGLSSTFTYLAKGRDGYVNDRNASDGSDPGAYDVDALRVALNWNPIDEFTAFYSYDYSDLTGQDALFQLVAISPAVLDGLHATSNIPERDDDRLGVANLDFHKPSTHRIGGHNLTLDYDLDFASVKSITTYRTWDNTEEGTELDGNAGLVADFFGAPVPVQLFAAINERDQDQFSQELQLYGPIGERVDYVTGIYYFEEDFDENNPQQFMFPTLGFGVPIPTPPATFPDPGTTLDYSGDAESWAVFTDWSWTPPVLEDRLKLSAGVRYSDDEKSFTQRTPVANRNDEDWSHVDWQGTGSFQWTDAIMTYVRVATGYKSGGFNPRSNDSDPFDEETVITYELGAKTELFDDRILFNAAVFLSDYDDLQIDQFVAGSGGAASVTVNAGKAHIWGIELEGGAQITDNIDAYVNYGWLDMEYDEFKILDPVTNMLDDVAEDAVFGYRPQQTLAAGLVFESDPLGDSGVVLGSRLDALYVDDIWWHPIDFTTAGNPITPFNDVIKEGGYTLLNASVSLAEIPLAGESRLRFTVWGRNLLDEEYRRSGIDFGALGFAGAIYGEPRTYGATMTFEY